MLNIAAYHKIVMVDGEGIRNSLYVSGCDFRCKGCYNAHAQNPEFGEPLTEEFVKQIISDLKPDYIKGMSLLGGDPFAKNNAKEVEKLIKRIKSEVPGKDYWAWSGYRFERLLKESPELLQEIDVLVDGPFIFKQFHPSLAFRGSRNQRIIDVKSSIDSGEVVLWNNGAYLEKEEGLFDN